MTADRVLQKAERFATLPDRFHLSGRPSAWIDANRPGLDTPSFLEGPAFAPDGALWVVDIPHGRLFRVTPDGLWSLELAYDGWPNGMVWRDDTAGRRFHIADYKRGLLTYRPGDDAPEILRESHRSEGFKGLNDLWFGPDGTLYVTDQGQTGLHDPTGRVYRLKPGAGDLDILIDTCPSPNGLITDIEGRALFVALTRACEVWRLPLFPGGTSKAQLFARLPAGLSGPDGMALDRAGNLYVCHASRGAVFVFDPHGVEIGHIDCRAIGRATTNLTFGGPDGDDLFITVSDSGAIARARAVA